MVGVFVMVGTFYGFNVPLNVLIDAVVDFVGDALFGIAMSLFVVSFGKVVGFFQDLLRYRWCQRLWFFVSFYMYGVVVEVE